MLEFANNRQILSFFNHQFMYIKKLIIVSTFIISFTSKAQKLEKGTWLVGGNLTFLNISQKVPVGSFGGGYGGQFGGYGSGYSSSPSPTTSVSTNIFVGSLSLSKMATKYFAIGAKASYINTGGVDGSILGPTTRFYVNYDKPSTFFLTGDYGWNTNGGGTALILGLVYPIY